MVSLQLFFGTPGWSRAGLCFSLETELHWPGEERAKLAIESSTLVFSWDERIDGRVERLKYF